MSKKKLNTDRLPMIGKDTITMFSLDQAPLVENQFATLKQKFSKGFIKKIDQDSEAGTEGPQGIDYNKTSKQK